MSVHESKDLVLHLQQFHTVYLRILQHLEATRPDFENSRHINMLMTIWDKAGLPALPSDRISQPVQVRWDRLGLEQGEAMFENAGTLGLWCLVSNPSCEFLATYLDKDLIRCRSTGTPRTRENTGM
jgi:hypothetical protein